MSPNEDTSYHRDTCHHGVSWENWCNKCEDEDSVFDPVEDKAELDYDDFLDDEDDEFYVHPHAEQLLTDKERLAQAHKRYSGNE